MSTNKHVALPFAEALNAFARTEVMPHKACPGLCGVNTAYGLLCNACDEAGITVDHCDYCDWPVPRDTTEKVGGLAACAECRKLAGIYE